MVMDAAMGTATVMATATEAVTAMAEVTAMEILRRTKNRKRETR